MSRAVGAGDDSAAGLRVLEVQDNSGDGPVLDSSFLFSADFIRAGDDLLLRGENGEEVLIEDYFEQSEPPALETPEGARLSGETVEALAQTSVVQQFAQAGGGGLSLGEPVGHVNLLNGTARVQRADGSREDLSNGDPIYEGDVVATGVGSELGILFIDETVFSLSANARMVINEMIYNSSSTVNSMSVSLIQGTFVFITGQVAPTGGMNVETPVGTIGIRGTTVGVEITSFGGFTTIANLVNPETGELGSFTFVNAAGEAIFSLANHYLEVRSANQVPGSPGIVSSQDIAQAFGRALNTAIQIQRNATRQQNDDPQSDPTQDQEGSLQGDILQALQQAGLTPEQIQQLLNAPAIETAAGPDSGSAGSGSSGTGGQNSGPLSSGSGVGGSQQTEAVQNGNGPATGGGSGLSTEGSLPQGNTPPGNPAGEPAGNAGGSGSTPPPVSSAPPPPPPPPPPDNEAPDAADDYFTVGEDGVNASTGATPEQVESFLGLSGGTLNALANDGNASNGDEVATSGTAMKTVVTVQAGDILSFTYNFLDSEDLSGAATYQDFAFVVINGEAFRLSNVGEANTPTGASFTLGGYSVQFDQESGYLTFQGTFTTSGSVTIGFGVMNEGDQVLDAGLLLDDLVITRGQQIVFQDDFTSLNNWQKLGGDYVTTVGDIGTSDPMPGGPSQALLISAAVTGGTANVLADNGNGPDSDPDGDPLTVTAVNGNSAAVGTQITLPSGALLTLYADGSFSYDPNGQFGDLEEGETAQDSFTYTISDGKGGSDTAAAHITIVGSSGGGTGNGNLIGGEEDPREENFLTLLAGEEEESFDTAGFAAANDDEPAAAAAAFYAPAESAGDPLDAGDLISDVAEVPGLPGGDSAAAAGEMQGGAPAPSGTLVVLAPPPVADLSVEDLPAVA